MFNGAGHALGVSDRRLVYILVLGGLTVTAFLFFSGRRLAGYAPKDSGRLGTAAQMVLLPVSRAMRLDVIVFQPLLPWFLVDMLGTNSLWLFAAIGAATKDPYSSRVDPGRICWADAVAALVLISAIRLLSTGIIILA